MKLIAFASLLMISLASYASKNVGNGGNGVVCGSSVELLDLYEMRAQAPHYRVQLEGRDYKEKVADFIARLATVSPLRANYYRTLEAHFMADDSFVNERLPALNDYGSLHWKIGDGCHIEQLAIQRNYPFQTFPIRLQIDSKLFFQMSDDDKAAFFVHEMLEAEASQWGATTSLHIRPLAAFFAGISRATLSEQVFVTSVLTAGLYTYEHGGFILTRKTGRGASEPEFRNFRVVKGYLYLTQRLSTSEVALSISGPIEFFPEGKVKSVCVAEGAATVFVGPKHQVREPATGSLVKFDDSGAVTDVVPPARAHCL